jgi:hypothetical protein
MNSSHEKHIKYKYKINYFYCTKLLNLNAVKTNAFYVDI